MANIDGNSAFPVYSNHQLRQRQLFSLIATLCASRQQLKNTDLRQLIVDSRLSWSFEPIDGASSWLHLTQPCKLQQMADCLVLSPD